MTESLTLGRVAGLRIGANWSVLVVLALIVVGLAAGRFPLAAPGRSTVAYAVAGTAAGLAFLASLLAHEISHAIIARRDGLQVEGLILWLFGGVALLRGEPRTAGSDLRIAGVGPAVSAVLGGVFLGMAALADIAGAGPLMIAALGWLGVINLALAVFNLIPAAPLDGGRILRAAVWRWTGNRHRAAVIAARAGVIVGFVLIGLGLAQVVLARGFGGLWLALVGWFVVNAARAEEQQTVLQRDLGGIRVGNVMTRNPMSALPAMTVQEFIDSYLLSHRFSGFPLLDREGRLAGLVTLNRIRAVPVHDHASTRLIDIACPPAEVPVAGPEEALVDLLTRMAGCTDGRAVVVDDTGRVVGILSPSDVARTVQTADLWSRARTAV